MKLYKFRPLGSCQDLDRAKQILATGQFWCSRFWELNDPMEGVYQFSDNQLNDEYIRRLFKGKSAYSICSFSGKEAFEDPLLWGYYANGFKGIAIEVEVEENAQDIHRVEYCDNVPRVFGDKQTTDVAMRILKTKLRNWKHENEYRFLSDGSYGSHKIGSIRAVYFGNPYGTIYNAKDIQDLHHVSKYLCRAGTLIQLARSRGIACHKVECDNGCVKDVGQIEGDDLIS